MKRCEDVVGVKTARVLAGQVSSVFEIGLPFRWSAEAYTTSERGARDGNHVFLGERCGAKEMGPGPEEA